MFWGFFCYNKLMEKRQLKTVTLVGIDCVDIDRLVLAMDICQENFEFAEVKILTSLASTNPNVIKIDPINSLEDYSRFVINNLSKYIGTEHILLVQHDGFILNPEAWNDEFLNYDYIGAPWLIGDWAIKNFDVSEDLLGKFIVGNGGFSLRSKKLLSLCSKLASEGKMPKYNPEDMAICIYYRKLMEENGIRFAPVELAEKFSYEALDDDKHYMWDGQFGFHGLSWTDISKWTKEHPEYHIENPASDIITR